MPTTCTRALPRRSSSMAPINVLNVLTLIWSAAMVNAQVQNLTVQTPTNVSQCVPVEVQWSGGVEPYTLLAVPLITTPLDTIQYFPGLVGHSFNWTPTFDPFTFAAIVVHDGTGKTGQSAGFRIGGSYDRSCVRSPSSTAAAQPTPSESQTLPSNDAVQREGLSGGAIAGIVVGGLALAALSGLVVMWIRRRRVQTFRRRHRATRSGASLPAPHQRNAHHTTRSFACVDWQPMADLPSPGGYVFKGGEAQVENVASFPAPPSPALKRPGEVGGGFAPRRPGLEYIPEEPPTSPL
ncbi:hypothetical protein C8Q77DRAFT_1112064 [Trametes polyzona]|nr:hypothetical protein C8Q77DRAFT_1112064 [Trametes polyzona]